jgi:hypothetical protein
MEELDLTNSKWVPENEIYLISIVESIKDLYPEIDLDSELKEMNYTLDNLINSNDVMNLMQKLSQKYPEEK